MARKAEKEKTKDGLKLKIVNPNAAGIDIAYGEMQVCVPEDRDGETIVVSAVSHATTRRLPRGSRPVASPQWRWSRQAPTGSACFSSLRKKVLMSCWPMRRM